METICGRLICMIPENSNGVSVINYQHSMAIFIYSKFSDPNSPNTSVFYCEVSTNSDWEKSWTVFEPNNEKIQYFGNEIAWFMRGDGIFIGTMLGDELIKVHNW
ncbi:hypothetical protein WR25_06466 isoform C [Diploscapter pachys]|uniref:Uncharacterized protein n=1 Tax=Diploscapter pachys TaxID=2018661 RepID=A0A2A2LF14_9BILA|nr:hypothetical protein WR25_06466 isoform B [Diploscapter pachys]PAV84861.1 hypothetical protein WR25_06466 isoform C [Diploscapter pachys]